MINQQQLKDSKFIHDYLLDDSYKHQEDANTSKTEELKTEHYRNNNRLAKSIEKDSHWGLGGELLKRKVGTFEQGRFPEPEEIEAFLRRELVKDIIIIDFQQKMIKDKGKWGMLGTGFSNRHIYKVGQTLVQLLKELEVPHRNTPRIFGRRDDEWIYIQVGRDIQLNLFTENLREDAALEAKWNSAFYFLEESVVEEENRTQGKYVKRNPFRFKDL